jgi:hypothetical protein
MEGRVSVTAKEICLPIFRSKVSLRLENTIIEMLKENKEILLVLRILRKH